MWLILAYAISVWQLKVRSPALERRAITFRPYGFVVWVYQFPTGVVISDCTQTSWRPGDFVAESLAVGMAYIRAEFFARDTLAVARDLIGTTLVVGSCEGKIVETEAYTTDAASHAVTRHKQAALMMKTFGHVYVYLIYGMYYCLNFTTERDGVGAVLIRAAEPLGGIDEMIERRGTTDLKKLASGPGRLAQAFRIDLRLNGKPIGREIKIRERRTMPRISAGPRIGISSATDLEWRFYETGNPFVSRPSTISGRLSAGEDIG